MDMSTDAMPPYVAAGRDDVNAGYKKPGLETKSVDPEAEEEKSLIEEVREKGFTQFVKEIEEKKKEEIREKILKAMGLSEEDLEKMPAEQRQQIEEMIAREIVERTAASAQMNGSTSAVVFQQASMSVQHTELTVSSTIASNMGLGPLLAVQETQGNQAETAAQKDREEELLGG